MLPVGLARCRVERDDRSRIPNDQLPGSSRRDDHRLRITLFGIRGQRPPDFLAGHLVERYHFGIRLAADNGDQAVPVDQGRARDSPSRHLHPVILNVIFSPDHVARSSVEAEERTAPPDNVNPVAVNGRRCPWPCVVADALVVCVPLARPENLAGFLIQAKGALHSLLSGRPFEVRYKNATRCNGRSCKAAVYRSAPDCGQSFLGEFIQDARLGPDTVSPLAAPFRPVLGKDGRKSNLKDAYDHKYRPDRSPHFFSPPREIEPYRAY